MIRWFSAVLLLGASVAHAQQVPTFRVNVRLVNVYVNATDAAGAPVANLTREDFRVSEDNVPQEIKVFEKQSEQPLNIVLAVDTSGSVRKDWQPEVAAATRFLHGLMRPVDKVALMEFSTHVREVVPFTNNPKLLAAGLKDLRGGYATAMYQTVQLASQDLHGMVGRKIIVIISDGGDTTHGVTYQDAFRSAIGAEASVYSIIDVPVEASAGRELGGEHALITLSEDTGGKFYYAGDPDKMEAAFHQLSSDLRTQYLIGYYAPERPAADDFRRIAITVKPGAATAGQIILRYRPGYYSPHSASE
jgi:Ca-activated chloride channel family protein